MHFHVHFPDKSDMELHLTVVSVGLLYYSEPRGLLREIVNLGFAI